MSIAVQRRPAKSRSDRIVAWVAVSDSKGNTQDYCNSFKDGTLLEMFFTFDVVIRDFGILGRCFLPHHVSGLPRREGGTLSRGQISDTR
jgi:hypothetical protein